MSETTLHKKIYWCNVGPDHIVIFSKKNNIKCCLGLPDKFAKKNNLQLHMDLSRPTLHNKITCGMLDDDQTTFLRKITYTMLCPPCWNNIAQEFYQVSVVQIRLRQYWTREYYLCNIGPECTDIFSQENQLYFQILLVACFLTGYNINKQSWLFSFNVDLEVHLQLEGQIEPWLTLTGTMQLKHFFNHCHSRG